VPALLEVLPPFVTPPPVVLSAPDVPDVADCCEPPELPPVVLPAVPEVPDCCDPPELPPVVPLPVLEVPELPKKFQMSPSFGQTPSC